MAFKEICISSKSCELMKSVNKPKYGSKTILTDSCWEYVSLFLKRQSIAGASDALFYWEQAHSFYLACLRLQCIGNIASTTWSTATMRSTEFRFPTSRPTSAAIPIAAIWPAPAWTRRHCSTWWDIRISVSPWTHIHILAWRMPKTRWSAWRNWTKQKKKSQRPPARRSRWRREASEQFDMEKRTPCWSWWSAGRFCWCYDGQRWYMHRLLFPSFFACSKIKVTYRCHVIRCII